MLKMDILQVQLHTQQTNIILTNFKVVKYVVALQVQCQMPTPTGHYSVLVVDQVIQDQPAL